MEVLPTMHALLKIALSFMQKLLLMDAWIKIVICLMELLLLMINSDESVSANDEKCNMSNNYLIHALKNGV